MVTWYTPYGKPKGLGLAPGLIWSKPFLGLDPKTNHSDVKVGQPRRQNLYDTNIQSTQTNGFAALWTSDLRLASNPKKL